MQAKLCKQNLRGQTVLNFRDGKISEGSNLEILFWCVFFPVLSRSVENLYKSENSG